MFHGEAFLSEIQQSGPRGADKLFSTNWWMPMAQRKFGKGTLTLRTMLSFEPATVSNAATRSFSRRAKPPSAAPSWTGSIPTIFSWSWPLCMTTRSQSVRWCPCTPRRWAIRRWGRRPILIGPRHPKIRLRRWDIISRTPPTLRRMSSRWASPIAACESRLPAFMGASPTSSAGTSIPERSTRGRPGSLPIPARTGVCNIPLRSCTARRNLPPLRTSDA